jgi:hypothetical protein
MSSVPSDLLLSVARVVAAFDELGVEYLVGGSIASSVFGEPRQTLDADLVARLFGRHAEPLAQSLGSDFYVELSTILTAIQTQGCFNLIHLETATKVEVFVRWRDPFGQSQFERRQRKSVGETSPHEFFFASAEDTVLAKLEWYQKGGAFPIGNGATCLAYSRFRDQLWIRATCGTGQKYLVLPSS